ncbi:hypothetical protein SVIOM342S_07336 [Streptomyces violaceorubidus]
MALQGGIGLDGGAVDVRLALGDDELAREEDVVGLLGGGRQRLGWFSMMTTPPGRTYWKKWSS